MRKSTYVTLVFLVMAILSLVGCAKPNEIIKGKITINEKEITLINDTNSSRVIFATLEHIEGDVNWLSSDESVVSVTADIDTTIARIKPHNVGVAYVSAIIGDVSAYCKVTVTQGHYLEVSKTTIYLSVGKTEALLVESNETNIQYSSTDPTVASVTSHGLITALKEGSTIISVKSSTQTVYVNVSVAEPGFSFSKSESIVLNPDHLKDSVSVVSKGGLDISKGVWSLEDEGIIDMVVNGDEVTLTAINTTMYQSTYVVFSLPGYPPIKKMVTVKPEDVTLTINPIVGTLFAKEESLTITYEMTPTQTGDNNKVLYSVSPEGVIDIQDGVITRNPSYVFEDDQIIVNIEVIPLIDPEASKVASITIENPLKGLKYITDVASFNRVMTAANNDSTIYLMNDIDLGGKVYSGQIMPGNFGGSFHGNGYKIHNFTAAGLFGTITGTVEHLMVEGNMSGSQRGFIGFHMTSTAIIRNVFIDVTFLKPSAYVAGLALMSQGSVSDIIMIARNPEMIQADMVYGGFVQGGTVDNVILHTVGGSIRNGAVGILLVNETQLRESETFASFDSRIWEIIDGEIPQLKKGE